MVAIGKNKLNGRVGRGGLEEGEGRKWRGVAFPLFSGLP